MPFVNKIVRKFAKQRAVLWRRVDSDRNRPVYADPVEIACRIEDRGQQLVTVDGRTVRSSAYVMTSAPVGAGDLFMKGTLAQWQALPTYPSPPTKLQGGFEVQIAGETPDLKAEEFLYEAYL